MLLGLLAPIRPNRRPVPRRRTPVGRSVVLKLEQLEARRCPSPVIASFSATPGYVGKQVELKGTVSDSNLPSVSVSFSGSGVSASTSVDSAGRFDLFTTASSLGNVTAVATASDGSSPTDSAVMVDTGPTISNFTAVEGQNNVWTFTGQVTGVEPTGGLVVTFGGSTLIDGMTAMVQPNGWFTMTVTLPPVVSFMATAQTTDCWGVNSNLAATFVGSPPQP